METQVLNIAPIVVWVIAFSQLLTFGLTVWNIMSSGSRSNARRIDEHERSLTNHDQRLSALEHDRKDAPTQKDFHELEVAMTELKGSIAVVLERLKPIEAIGDRAQEWMLEQGRR